MSLPSIAVCYVYVLMCVTDYPDAPLDVQVESGPQEKSLLVTWLPVTLTANGTSNGTIVTGYTVLVNGQKVKEIASPTGRSRSKILSVKGKNSQ